MSLLNLLGFGYQRGDRDRHVLPAVKLAKADLSHARRV